MLFLLASITLFGIVLLGLGKLAGFALGFKETHNPWFYWWLGIVSSGALAILVSFFAPVNLVCFIAFMITGCTGFVVWLKEYRNEMSRHSRTKNIVFHVCVFFLALTVSCLFSYSTWQNFAYDTDLYHAQTVRWLNEYGTVKGLGNLHSRLGFNSLWLALASLLDNGVWDARSAWLMPLVMIVGGVLYFLYEVFFNNNNEYGGDISMRCVFYVGWVCPFHTLQTCTTMTRYMS